MNFFSRFKNVIKRVFTRSKQSKYTSDTSWENMPDPLKNMMGMYLLKPDIIDSQSTSKEINQALGDRRNVDLPYIDRTKKPYLYCAAMPCLFMIRDLQSLGDAAETSHDICMAAICVTVMFICLCPPTTLLSSIGLFADGVRAAKRNHDEAKDEIFHRKIVGPATQVMK